MNFKKIITSIIIMTCAVTAGCSGSSRQSQGNSASSSQSSQAQYDSGASSQAQSSGFQKEQPSTDSFRTQTRETIAGSAEPEACTADDDGSYSSAGASYTDLNSFTAQTLDGSEFTQDDLADADVTVINCWTTTCGYCMSELPVLAKLQKSLPSNVKLITICLDGQYSPNDAKQILDVAGYSGTTLISGDGNFADLCAEVIYTPTTLLATSEGNIVGPEMVGYDKNITTTLKDNINSVLEKMGKENI